MTVTGALLECGTKLQEEYNDNKVLNLNIRSVIVMIKSDDIDWQKSINQ